MSKCTRDNAGRVTPCTKRATIGPSEFAYGNSVHCAYCDAFLRPVQAVKGVKTK